MANFYLHKDNEVTLVGASRTLFKLSRPEEVVHPDDVTLYLFPVYPLYDVGGTPLDHYVLFLPDGETTPISSWLEDDEVYERIMGTFWKGLTEEEKQQAKDYIQTHDILPVGPFLNQLLGESRVLTLSELHDNGWYLDDET